MGFISVEGFGTFDGETPALDLFGRVVKIKNVLLERGDRA